MLRVEEIRTLSEFGKLREEWGQLQRAAGSPSLFLSFDWFRVCAQNLRADQQMLILLLRDGTRLVGIAPLMQRRTQVRHFPVNQIEFLANPLSPFADFILIDPTQGLSVILAYLQESRIGWDRLSLDKLHQESPHLQLLCSFLEGGCFTFQKRVVSRTPYLNINQPWEEFYQSQSPKFRKTRRSVANRMRRLGNITVELVTSSENAAWALGQLLALSGRSWKHERGVDYLSPAFEQRLLRDLTQVAGEAGWLRFWLLKKGDQVLAAEFHLDDRGISYGLRTCFDRTYASYSPGTYLDFQIVERLFKDGCVCYDMGPGAADYKLAWTRSAYLRYAVDVYNRKFYPQILGRLQTCWIPAVKASSVGRLIRGRSHT